MIITRTPFRVSLFGGGTDYPEWFLKNNGYVISSSIKKYCYINIRELPNYFDYNYRIRFFKEQCAKNINQIKHPIVRNTIKLLKIKKNLEIIHQGDLPGLSGLGASSSFTVGLLHGLMEFKNLKFNREDIFKKAIHVERYLTKEKVGYQDQIATAIGGINFIKFQKNKKITIKKINISQNNLKKIVNHSILIHTGERSNNNNLLNEITSNIKKKKKFDLLNDISLSTLDAYKNMKNNKLCLNTLADIINYQWDRKKQIESKISNSKINSLYNFAMENGALGGKLLGAGSGGYLFFLFDEHSIKKFQKKLSNKISLLKFEPEFCGTKIIYNNFKITK